MKIPGDIRYSEEMLREAMELMKDVYDKFDLFERQYYWELKKRYDQHEALNDNLRAALNGIDTEGREC